MGGGAPDAAYFCAVALQLHGSYDDQRLGRCADTPLRALRLPAQPRALRHFWDEGMAIRLLLHDRDAIYGWEFNQIVKALCIHQIRSAPKSESGISTLRGPCSISQTVLFGTKESSNAMVLYG